MSSEHPALQVLSQALQLEKDGRAFYLQAAERMHDERCQRTFRALADDERIHEEMILRQLHAVEGEGHYVLLPDLQVQRIDLEERLFPPSGPELNAKLQRTYDELSALQMALEIEIKSFDLYRQAAARESDEAARQMYLWLAAAEHTHFDMLMANYETLSSESAWV